MTRHEPTAGRLPAVVIAATIAIGLVLVPVPAVASQPTSIAFAGESNVTAPFASDWNLSLVVTTDYWGDGTLQRLGTTDGTVDVYVSGVGGAFATSLPIQPDGIVYVSQPLAKPLLPAGTYQLTAIYNPAAGGPYATSQTAVPATLEITPLSLQTSVEVTNDAAVSKYPVITASVTGEFVESTGGAPAGTWSFSVTDENASEVFEAEVAQQYGQTTPLTVEIATKLATGTTYTVATTFTAVDELAAGLTVSQAPTASFETPGTTIADALSARIPFPWYLVLALGVLLVGLVTTVVILAVKLSRRQQVKGTPAADRGPSEPRLPGEPRDVEILSWEDAGITAQPTTVLPTSTNWSLTESGGVTERLDLPADSVTENEEGVESDGGRNADGDTETASEPQRDRKAPKSPPAP